jgi:hypothetical protein
MISFIYLGYSDYPVRLTFTGKMNVSFVTELSHGFDQLRGYDSYRHVESDIIYSLFEN